MPFNGPLNKFKAVHRVTSLSKEAYLKQGGFEVVDDLATAVTFSGSVYGKSAYTIPPMKGYLGTWWGECLRDLFKLRYIVMHRAYWWISARTGK